MAKGGVTVETRGDKLAPMISRLGKAEQVTKIGWLATAISYPDGTDVRVVAAAHEFGTPTVKARAPLRRYFDSGGVRELEAATAKALGQVLDGKPPATIGDDVGAVGVKGVKMTIERGLPPPLKSSTTDNPNRNPTEIPLLDTGHLVSQIASEAKPS